MSYYFELLEFLLSMFTNLSKNIKRKTLRNKDVFISRDPIAIVLQWF